jgi:hypothetical protein
MASRDCLTHGLTTFVDHFRLNIMCIADQRDISMRTNIVIDDELMEEALKASGATRTIGAREHC